MAEIARREIGKIAFRQRLEMEARAARTQKQLRRLACHIERNLGSVRQFAHNLVEDMRRQRRPTRLSHIRRQPVGDFKIEIGRLEQNRTAFRTEKNIGQDRNRRAPFDDAVHMAERL